MPRTRGLLDDRKAIIAKVNAKKQKRGKAKRKDAKIKKAYLKRIQDKVANEVIDKVLAEKA